MSGASSAGVLEAIWRKVPRFSALRRQPAWLGAAIVIACGLYVGWTHTRREVRT